jgi:hypothetical protein
MAKIWDRIMAVVGPLQSIATSLLSIAGDLKAMRELYEMQMAHHKPPIYRITEAASEDDTEVSYGEEDEKTKLYRYLIDGEDKDRLEQEDD